MKKTSMVNVVTFKYFNLLATFYSSVLFIAVFLDYKFINVFGLLASTATFVISLTFFLGDLMTEVYGIERARQIIWSNIYVLLFFAIICLLVNNINTPEQYAKYGEAYKTMLNVLPRACLSNAFAIFIGMYLNTYIVSKWKIILKGEKFWLRSFLASACGEAIYTVMVVSLINIGLVPIHHVIEIFIVSYSFKLVFGFFVIIPISLIARFLKKEEEVDLYDYGVNYNPFTFLLSKKYDQKKKDNNGIIIIGDIDVNNNSADIVK